MPRVLVILLALTAVPDIASACTCVVDSRVPFTIAADAKSLFLTGTVRDVQRLADNTAVRAVLVDIGESMLNAPTEEMTLYTASAEERCGYAFQAGHIYVIQTDAMNGSGETFDRFWHGVLPGSQGVHRCGKTGELNTSEGDTALADVREALAVRARVLARAGVPVASLSADDLDVWNAAVTAMNAEHRLWTLMVNETLPAAEFADRLQRVTRDRPLGEALLTRNAFSVRVTTTPESAVMIDAGAMMMLDAATSRGEQHMPYVRLSLPVFSDNGLRALVFTYWNGGFDNVRGGGYLFEKRNGEWVLVDLPGMWMS